MNTPTITATMPVSAMTSTASISVKPRRRRGEVWGLRGIVSAGRVGRVAEAVAGQRDVLAAAGDEHVHAQHGIAGEAEGGARARDRDAGRKVAQLGEGGAVQARDAG